LRIKTDQTRGNTEVKLGICVYRDNFSAAERAGHEQKFMNLEREAPTVLGHIRRIREVLSR